MVAFGSRAFMFSLSQHEFRQATSIRNRLAAAGIAAHTFLIAPNII